MDDSEAQFFVTVGDLCAAAHLAGLSVCLTVLGGQEIVGVPAPPFETDADHELDTTGSADAVWVAEVEVRLSDVVEASVGRPEQT